MNPQIRSEIPKFKALRKQLESVENNDMRPPGTLIVIDCPWCHKSNIEGMKFCCDSLRRAIQLILSEPPAKANLA